MPVMKKLPYILLYFICCFTNVAAQPLCTVTRYDDDNGMIQCHVTQIMQDNNGMIWLATWNGLNRFDGYDFECFKPRVGDGTDMRTDRIRNIWPEKDNIIGCKVDEQYYVFDTRTNKFRHSPKRTVDGKGKSKALKNRKSIDHIDKYGVRWTIENTGRLYYYDEKRKRRIEYPLDFELGKIKFCMPDRQGNLWLLGEYSVYKLCFSSHPSEPLLQKNPTLVRCLFVDDRQRYWVTTKEDATVKIMSKDNQLVGYLAPDGKITKNYVRFGSPVYCITRSSDGNIWLGTKPNGLFRLSDTGNGMYSIKKIHGLNNENIYDIREDKYHRLWIATLGGGINCVSRITSDKPLVCNMDNMMKSYPRTDYRRVRYIHITNDGILLAATTDGLVVSDASRQKDIRKGIFRCHTREADRTNSLSCSAVMDIVEDSRHLIYISTESGGMNKILSKNLLDRKLEFRHYNTQTGLPSDVIYSLTPIGDKLLAVCNNLIVVVNPSDGSNETFDSHFFHSRCHFSDAHPRLLPDGRWLFGMQDGAFYLNMKNLRKSKYTPPIALTSIAIQDKLPVMAVNHLDTLTLQPDERNVTISFAALDYADGSKIKYAFRMVDADSKQCDDDGAKGWNSLGYGHTATLLDLKPGTYCLQIKSTNAEGIWTDNVRSLRIIVVPRFVETTFAMILAILLSLLIIGVVIYTIVYIRRIKRKQHETMEAYLTLLKTEKGDAVQEKGYANDTKTTDDVSIEDDRMMKLVMKFVDEHIGDSDCSIGDMAEAAATSRSGLQRRMKQLTGVSPLEFMREARIKRACELLHDPKCTIGEVAFACGFSDPKYFSRSFKTSVGVSPSEYKAKYC